MRPWKGCPGGSDQILGLNVRNLHPRRATSRNGRLRCIGVWFAGHPRGDHCDVVPQLALFVLVQRQPRRRFRKVDGKGAFPDNGTSTPQRRRPMPQPISWTNVGTRPHPRFFGVTEGHVRAHRRSLSGPDHRRGLNGRSLPPRVQAKTGYRGLPRHRSTSARSCACKWRREGSRGCRNVMCPAGQGAQWRPARYSGKPRCRESPLHRGKARGSR